MDSSRSTKTGPSLPVVSGAVAGIGAYLVGYLVTYVWKAQAVQESLGPINSVAEFFGSDPIPAWKIVGWLYYSGHLVDAKLDFGPTGPRFVNLVQEGSGNLELLYLLPPLVLLGAGAAVAVRHADVTQSEAMKSGATVTTGYLVSAIVGAVLFQVEGNGPDVVPAILLAGAVYPLVFASLGGVAGHLVRRRRRPETPPATD